MPNYDQISPASVKSITVLRRRWEELHGSPPPAGLGRDLLSRAISSKEQEHIHGGTPASLKRELERLAQQLGRSGDLDVERQLSGLIALGVTIFITAERAACAVTAQLHPHRVKTFRARMLKIIAWFAVATAVPVLVAIWL
ncbi:MAG TPA: hypothetical protein VGW38_04505 [Chloroflexota bacterium]|nr:hypothetical protein [Chloroflexota bacterium]